MFPPGLDPEQIQPGSMTGLEAPTEYDRLADFYYGRFGEPLVADREWCQPYLDAARVAVEVDPALDPDFGVQTRTDFESEVTHRAAFAIAMLTHGEKILAERRS